MSRYGHWLGLSVAFLVGGCAQLPEFALPKHSYALDISQPGTAQTRAQMPDVSKKAQIASPLPLDVPRPQGFDQPAPTPKPAIEQVSFANRGTVRVRVRAWVNGRPIFDNEVMQMAGPDLNRLSPGLSSAERSQRMADIINASIEQLIDQELMYQDAVKKLEKGNPTALDKLREYVDMEFDKTLERMRKAKVTESEIREIEPAARRMMERNLISSEYARSRIKPIVDTRIGLMEVREYYETHLNEFQSEDKVVWKDVFIPLSPNHPTIDVLKRFAEDLANRCRNEADFNKLIAFDGLGKNGEGLGQRRGEIRPSELEKILFEMRPGTIGPVVAFPTGVHLIWLTNREHKGQLPLNDEVAKIIRKKLEKEVADREYRRLVRELRVRAVWRVEKDS